ncbi:hypothetical protein HO173_004194 [Letharia columbiana]|uniref:CENP-C homolog n=1 Tax=Letharia columbiana TaxID=112416 RepID=A0A8H6G040_9LECA|nr:uncharacterized protein HO173_004194 [Letharia columbiana]KAF6237993.1 hypothetical protein HO173_004194 [Letharia columbiana]
MAPRKTPRKERGPGDYTALGRRGRRTGVELKDTGVRDENGMEPIPSFSSPAKSVFHPNGISHDVTDSADDSMDIVESTIPEPSELVRSTRNGRISLPPRATSPIKTHLNSSPRRSMPRSVGPMSSPSRNLNNGTPTRATSHPPPNRVNRQLDFSMDKPRMSIERSPAKASVPKLKQPNLASATGKSKNKRPFDLSMGDDFDDGDSDALNGESTTNGIIYDEDDAILPNGDDHATGESTLEPGMPREDYTEQQPQGSEPEESQMAEPEATAGAKEAKEPKRKPGRAPKAMMVDPNGSQMSLLMPAPATPRRGRPKKARTDIFRDEEVEQPAAPLPAPAQTSKGKGKKPTERDPNVQMKATKKASDKPSSVRARSASRSRFNPRSETPANDNGALLTRSGRHSIKPLASWRGERFVFGDRTTDSLPGIKEIVRVDEVVEERPKQKYRYKKNQSRAKSHLEEVEEEDEEKDDWERDTGIMHANVMDWDPSTGKFNEENTWEQEVAYSFEAIEMRDISGADFKFAKTLTLDFFGSGMVDLPPGGAKRVKNSRKMQMVFFVFYGRVEVSMGTPLKTFSIGKGGQWQVPRGNFYSITNRSPTKPARIFFAQGCEVLANTLDESAMS